MSEKINADETEAKHQQIAEAFGRERDHLAKFQPQMEELNAAGIDSFEMFVEEVVTVQYTPSTVSNYENAFRHWQEFMAGRGRHAACPAEKHVKQFARWCMIEKGNAPGTAASKLSKLKGYYKYLCNAGSFPHDSDFDPFTSARPKLELDRKDPDPPRNMGVGDLRDVLEDVTHIRDRALIVMQLKTGLRASELANIKLSEIHIANEDLRAHYPDLGEHFALSERGRTNAVFIPHDREHNKSERPRVIPLDGEVRQLLVRYLLIRPDVDKEWVFLSRKKHYQLAQTGINEIWKEHFHPDWGPTDRRRGVTSHFGRHFMTNWFTLKGPKTMKRAWRQYLRGDKQSSGQIKGTRDAIDSYIHAYYEDVEAEYRPNIFKLRL